MLEVSLMTRKNQSKLLWKTLEIFLVLILANSNISFKKLQKKFETSANILYSLFPIFLILDQVQVKFAKLDKLV